MYQFLNSEFGIFVKVNAIGLPRAPSNRRKYKQECIQ